MPLCGCVRVRVCARRACHASARQEEAPPPLNDPCPLPQSVVMMTIALVALTANVSCLLLISRHRGGGAHMKASWIFSANDVLINVGVIVAGALVAWTGSNLPDLVIGTATGLIVLNGARRILSIRE